MGSAHMLSPFAFIAPLLAAAQLLSPASIRSSLDAYVAGHPQASLIVGVVDGNAVNVYSAAGVQAQIPTTSSTYQIGSVTKTFTATLLASMSLEGSVGLNDPISKYLPSGVAAPVFEGKAISLLSLAEQNSGLARLPPNFSPTSDGDPYTGYTVADLYRGLEMTKLTRAPGSRYEYSNFGVALLGQLLANRMHSSYASLLRKSVLGPLGMKDTVVSGTPASRARLVPGYDLDGTPQPPWNFGMLGAAGAIESDMRDMLVYLQANMNAPKGPLGPAMADAQRPRVLFGVADSPRIGLVWMTDPQNGFVWHNGQTGGYHAFLGFDPVARRGVVLLGNIADMDLDLIGVHVLSP